jgi:D-alanyl-D-alanine carboxypeptidase
VTDDRFWVGSVTVRQLLNHTSGLPDYFADPSVERRLASDPNSVIPPRTLIARASSHAVSFPPGTDWSYSNTNYLVLGLIIRKLTGKSVGEVLADRIFRVLPLVRTTFESPSRHRSGQMHGYDVSGKRPRDVTAMTLGGPWADGAIVSNTSDLARFFAALLSGELLRKSVLAEMQQTVDADGARAGLGIFRVQVYCGFAWGHDGGTPGYLTQVLATKDGSKVVVMAVNAGNPEVGGALRGTAELAYCS